MTLVFVKLIKKCVKISCILLLPGWWCHNRLVNVCKSSLVRVVCCSLSFSCYVFLGRCSPIFKWTPYSYTPKFVLLLYSSLPGLWDRIGCLCGESSHPRCTVIFLSAWSLLLLPPFSLRSPWMPPPSCSHVPVGCYVWICAGVSECILCLVVVWWSHDFFIQIFCKFHFHHVSFGPSQSHCFALFTFI